jgi:aspartate ammonia-lyase
MDMNDLVTVMGSVLGDIDDALNSPELNNQPGNWQALHALREQLDQQQKDLVQKTIQQDDAAFQVLGNEMQAAAKTVHEDIKDISKIDAVIKEVSEISANADQVLKLV